MSQKRKLAVRKHELPAPEPSPVRAVRLVVARRTAASSSTNPGMITTGNGWGVPRRFFSHSMGQDGMMKSERAYTTALMTNHPRLGFDRHSNGPTESRLSKCQRQQPRVRMSSRHDERRPLCHIGCDEKRSRSGKIDRRSYPSPGDQPDLELAAANAEERALPRNTGARR